jgi:N utilization substance protein B
MLALDDVPARVAINEAVELSKKYDDEKSYVFVNGVLNAIATELGEK